jgi:hypothetical protein
MSDGFSRQPTKIIDLSNFQNIQNLRKELEDIQQLSNDMFEIIQNNGDPIEAKAKYDLLLEQILRIERTLKQNNINDLGRGKSEEDSLKDPFGEEALETAKSVKFFKGQLAENTNICKRRIDAFVNSK